MTTARQPLTPLKQISSPLVKEHAITINRTPLGPEITINLPTTPLSRILFNQPNDSNNNSIQSPVLMSPLKNRNILLDEDKENSFFSCAAIPFKYFLNPNQKSDTNTTKLQKLQKELNQTHLQIQNLKEKTENEISNLIQSNLNYKLNLKLLQEETLKLEEKNQIILKENLELKKENEILIQKIEKEKRKKLEEEKVNVEEKQKEVKEVKIEEESTNITSIPVLKKEMNEFEKIKEEKEATKIDITTSSSSIVELSTFVILIGIVVMLF